MVDFKKICRACNSEKSNLLNFYSIDEEPTLGEMYSSITMLELNESDGLPEHICYACAKKLEAAYSFQKSCQKNEKQIKNTYEKLHKQTVIVPIFENIEKKRKVEEDKNLNKSADSNNKLNINTSKDITKFDQATDISVQNLPEELEAPPHKKQKSSVIDKIETIKQEDVTFDKEFTCDECDKQFLTNVALTMHKKLYRNKKSHTKESENPSLKSNEKFYCKTCNITFVTLFDFKKHSETHLLSLRKNNRARNAIN